MTEPIDGRDMNDCSVAGALAPVVEYFSSCAHDYDTRSERFPWAWVRGRELAAIRFLLGDVAGAEVLELGAGAGFYARELIRFGARHVWAVDLSDAMLAALPRGPVTAVLGRAETIRLDRRFPFLLSAGMLEFVPQPAAALVNAAKHAESGSRFILLVPRTNAMGYLYRQFHRAHGLNINLFDRTWFETVAPSSGWHVDTIIRVFPFSFAVRLHRS